MIQTVRLLAALLIGGVIGAAAVPSLQAQPSRRGAYVISETHVIDPAGFTEFVKAEPATLAPFHGRVLARALPDVREGAAPDGTVAILAFDSLEDANRWYNAPDTIKLMERRRASAKSKVYILDGQIQ